MHHPTRRLAAPLLAIGAAIGAALVHTAAQAEFLELYTTNPTSFRQSAGGSASVTYTARLTGMGNNVVSAYDIGVIYNPAFLTLQSFAFDASNLLGDPSANDGEFATEVLQQNHLDATNDPNPPFPFTNPATPPLHSTWDYRDDSSDSNPAPTNLTYAPLGGADPDLGTPDITAAYSINEGSLRFSAVSFLSASELETLQLLRPNNDVTPLFQVTFLVDLSEAGRTPVNIVYSTDYTGTGTIGDQLDLKYNQSPTAQYPTRVNAVVAVPIPGPLCLMLPVLALAALRRRT